MNFVDGPPAGEFVNFPLGSDNYYRFPLDTNEFPSETDYSVVFLSDGRSVFVPTTVQVQIGTVWGHTMWEDVATLEQRLLDRAARYLIVRESADAEPDVRDVQASSITGEIAEITPVSYQLKYTRRVRITRIEPMGSAVSEMFAFTRPTPSAEGACACVLSVNPESCGERLAFVLTSPP